MGVSSGKEYSVKGPYWKLELVFGICELRKKTKSGSVSKRFKMSQFSQRLHKDKIIEILCRSHGAESHFGNSLNKK